MSNFKYLLILLLIKNLFAYDIEDFNLKNELRKLRSVDSNISLEAQTTEGSNVSFYINKKNEIIAIEMDYYGESGKKMEYIFFMPKNYIIVFEHYGYDYPLSIENSKVINKNQKQYLLKYNEDFNYIFINENTKNEIKKLVKNIKNICKKETKYLCNNLSLISE